MQDRHSAREHVYTVDTHANYPPLPPRLAPSPAPPPPPPRGAWSCQAVVIMLMCLMFCGMTIQAVFLYRLYNPAAAAATADSVSTSKMTQDKGHGSPAANGPVRPSKPAAHLTDGWNIHHGKEIMSWSTAGYSFLHEMKYKDGQLIVKKEGFYYIYSKVFFVERATFEHSVSLSTRLYPHKSIAVMKARKYPASPITPTKSNSYLGGVFHLKKGDTLSIEVLNTSQIIQTSPSENFFGAYMI